MFFSIDELDAGNDFGDQFRAVEPAPVFLSFQPKFKDHGQCRDSRAGTFSSMGSKPDGSPALEFGQFRRRKKWPGRPRRGRELESEGARFTLWRGGASTPAMLGLPAEPCAPEGRLENRPALQAPVIDDI